MTALRRMFGRLLVCVLLLEGIQPFTLSAQQTPDLSAYQPSDDSVRLNYVRASGPDLRLYTGSEYIPNGRRTKGFAFYQSADPLPGSLFYDDNLYENMSVQYDLVRDRVIIGNYAGDGKIELVHEKLLNFSIAGRPFVYLTPRGGKAGYYAVLYKGKVSIYARYEKKLVLPSNLEDLPRYDDYHNYFVLKDGEYHEVGSKGAFLDLFRDQRDQLKRYIRANHLNFSRDWEGAMIKTAAYYDELKK